MDVNSPWSLSDRYQITSALRFSHSSQCLKTAAFLGPLRAQVQSQKYLCTSGLGDTCTNVRLVVSVYAEAAGETYTRLLVHYQSDFLSCMRANNLRHSLGAVQLLDIRI
ncbi:hypothetical protein BaRGS_00024204 [Batillaria attramentaria]|uniref:Uncharacterized protein n=1 Tax=Batillaria attramentaria TaxID=370345 RepID=A0ABD0KBY5_9CAEN